MSPPLRLPDAPKNSGSRVLTSSTVESSIAVGARTERLDWSVLFAAHAGELARYLERLTGDAEAARELTQDTFVRAIHAEDDLRDIRAVRAWLFRIATNLARKHLRRRRLIAFLPWRNADPAPTPEPDTESLLVRQTLRAIAPKEASALLLHYYVGLTRREIADVEEIGEEAVKSRLARGRKHFLTAYTQAKGGTGR